MNALELASAALGIAGALLLAFKSPKAGWAFVLWLFSNIGWIVFGWINEHWFLVLQNIAFAITSLIGIWIWFSIGLVGGALADSGTGDE